KSIQRKPHLTGMVTTSQTHMQPGTGIEPWSSRKKALANSVDPDETQHDAVSHQGLRCLLKGISRWNRILKAFANSLDPDETPQNVASHQDPNYARFCGVSSGSKLFAQAFKIRFPH
ncbi:hypothetical protein DPMN_171783, partial [Dreissena polymorpha]